jgi:hypothetical protein
MKPRFPEGRPKTEAEWLERKRMLMEWVRSPEFFAPEPAPLKVVTIPLTDADAAVVKANPESVRVSARREDGVSVLMRPHANPLHVRVMVDSVREVDAQGRPIWPTGGAISNYNPYDRL